MYICALRGNELHRYQYKQPTLMWNLPHAECVYLGMRVPDGQVFVRPGDNCQQCTCTRGEVTCRSLGPCPRLPCRVTQTPPGACCPQCVSEYSQVSEAQSSVAWVLHWLVFIVNLRYYFLFFFWIIFAIHEGRLLCWLKLILWSVTTFSYFFSSPKHKVLRVSYCYRPLSVVRRRASSVVRCASCVVRRP